MLRVLKAREHIAYQLALTSSELRDLFQRAPPIPDAENDGDDANGNRKPIEGDCPICKSTIVSYQQNANRLLKASQNSKQIRKH